MSHQPPPELFAERPVRSELARKRSVGIPYAARRAITIAVVGCVVGGVAYGLYSIGNKAPDPATVPTIKAEGNYKQKPQQPGGIDIPHQDVEVYHSLDNGEGSGKPEIEHLLPGPEIPQISENSSAHSVTVPVNKPPGDLDANSLAIPNGPESLIPPVPTPKQLATTATQPPASAAPVSMSAVVPVPTTSVPPPATLQPVVPAPITPAAPTPPPPAAKSLGAEAPDGSSQSASVIKGHTAVQLASIPDEAQAETTMAHLQTKYAAILGGAKLRVVRADLGDKGIYYRIQSQSLSEQRADRICSAIKGQNAGCILVRQ